MPKKSIFWGTLALLLFSTVAYALYGDDDDDDEDLNDNVTVETDRDFQKTWSSTMYVAIKDGNNNSPDNKIKVKTNVDKDTGNGGKEFWRTDDDLTFSFHLPNKARLSVDLKLASKAGLDGEAIILWNDENLKVDGKRQIIKFDGLGSSERLKLTSNQEENTLTLLCIRGEIGVESLKIKATIAYPKYFHDGVNLRLTAPDPSIPLDGSPVTIRWEEASYDMPEKGWAKMYYRIQGQDWQEIPDMKGITYGSKNWGKVVWKNPPKDKYCDFKPEFHSGPNPDDERDIILSSAVRRLLIGKKKFLDETEQMIPSSWWSKYFKNLRTAKNQLKDIIEEDEEAEKMLEENGANDDENNANIVTKERIKHILALEEVYFEVFQSIMTIAPKIQDQKDREEIQTCVDEFMDKLVDEFSKASSRYGSNDDTKKLVIELFPKERFAAIQKAKQEFDETLAKNDRLATAYELGARYMNPVKKVLPLPHMADGDVYMTSIIFTRKNDILISFRATSPNQPGCSHVTTSLKDPNAYGGSIKASQDKNSIVAFLTEDNSYEYENGYSSYTYTWKDSEGEIHSFDEKCKGKPVVSADQRFLWKMYVVDSKTYWHVEDYQINVCLPPVESSDCKNVQFSMNSDLFFEEGNTLNKWHLDGGTTRNQVLDFYRDNVLTYAISENGRYIAYITKDSEGFIKDLNDNSIMEIDSGNPLKNRPRHVYMRNNVVVFTGSEGLLAYSINGAKLGEFSIDQDEIMAISPDGAAVLCDGKILEIHTGVTLTEVLKNARLVKWDGDGLYLWSDKETRLVHYTFN